MTISITIDKPLLRRIDSAAKAARRTRSEVFRFALRQWLDTGRRHQLASEDRAGYTTHPVQPDEFEGVIEAQDVGTTDDSDRCTW